MISSALYKSITEVLVNASPQVRLTNSWRTLHEEYGIGSLTTCRKLLRLTPSDRQALVNWAQHELGVDPRQMSHEQAMKRTRTQAAASSNQEKGLSAAVRSNHLELRSLTGQVGEYRHPFGGYLGLSVDEALSLPFTHIITVENFDTFLCLNPEHLPMLPCASSLLVFRGDNKAHPGAVKKLIKATSARLFHYGDYDPAGLRIGFNMMPGTQLLLPDLAHITASQSANTAFVRLSKLNVFAKQETILGQLEQGVAALSIEMAAHLQFIRTNHIAITQESLMAKQVPMMMAVPIG